MPRLARTVGAVPALRLVELLGSHPASAVALAQIWLGAHPAAPEAFAVWFNLGVALLQARAIENQAWVIGVNRAGTDPNATYSGRSVVVDPMGVVRLDAGEGERWVALDVDVAEVRAWREAFPALKDRREGWTG